MSDLRPDTVLYRAPELWLTLYSDNCIRVFVDGRAFGAGANALRVLEAFASPAQVGDVVAALGTGAAGAADWMDLTATIVQLRDAGALLDPSGAPPPLRSSATPGFDSAAVHASLLNDRRRTEAFLEAVRRGVGEGDVVVDLGTGTGVLAAAAARAGAHRVYAIEASGIAAAASAVFEVNDVADRVTLVPRWSLSARLPERADVLISEVVGNEPLGEMILESMGDAVRRMLKPGGRVVPRRMTVYGVPVTVPDRVLSGRTFSRASVDAWREWYGLDFEPLVDFGRRGPTVLYRRPGEDGVGDWPRLATPVALFEIDFLELERPMLDATVELAIERTGRLDALLVYFELDLGEGVSFGTHPDDTDTTCSWRYPIWVLPERFDGREGERVEVRYRHAVPGARNRLEIRRIQTAG